MVVMVCFWLHPNSVLGVTGTGAPVYYPGSGRAQYPCSSAALPPHVCMWATWFSHRPSAEGINKCGSSLERSSSEETPPLLKAPNWDADHRCGFFQDANHVAGKPELPFI